MSQQQPRRLVAILVFLGHAAWFGMHLPTQALLTLAAFCVWLAVLMWGCVLPTPRRSGVIRD